jgi:hypothetical protein
LSQHIRLRGYGRKKLVNTLIARRVVLGGIQAVHGDPVSLEVLLGYRPREPRRVRRKRCISAAFTQFRHRLGIQLNEARLGWGLLAEEEQWLAQFVSLDSIRQGEQVVA